MNRLNDTDPGQFLTDFLTSFHRDLLSGGEDAGPIVDRYHTRNIVQVADGHRMDRDKLIAHARPVRRNRPSARVEMHEAVADADRIAARYTLHVRDRKRTLAIEVCFFGRFTPDGRMRQSHMLTRTLPADPAPPAPEPQTRA